MTGWNKPKGSWNKVHARCVQRPAAINSSQREPGDLPTSCTQYVSVCTARDASVVGTQGSQGVRTSTRAYLLGRRCMKGGSLDSWHWSEP